MVTVTFFIVFSSLIYYAINRQISMLLLTPSQIESRRLFVLKAIGFFLKPIRFLFYVSPLQKHTNNYNVTALL